MDARQVSTESALGPDSASAPAPSAKPKVSRQTPRRGARLARQTSNSEANSSYVVETLGARRLVVAASDPRDRRVAAIATRQRGIVARDQLLAIGVSEQAIQRMLANGRLLRLHRAVYAVGPTAGDLALAREAAALLACRPAAALSNETAAALWRVPHDRPFPTTPHVTVAAARGGIRPLGIHIHRTLHLTSADLQIRGNLPVTSPARTLVDLAKTATDRELERSVHEALVQRLTSERQLRDTAARVRSQGTTRLLEFITGIGEIALTRSAAEELFFSLIRDAGLPAPRVNVYVEGCLVDFYWPEHGVVVEIDGAQFHSTRSVFERDREKAAKLTAAGIVVVRLTWRQMKNTPLQVVAQTAQVLAHAATRRATMKP